MRAVLVLALIAALSNVRVQAQSTHDDESVLHWLDQFSNATFHPVEEILFGEAGADDDALLAAQADGLNFESTEEQDDQNKITQGDNDDGDDDSEDVVDLEQRSVFRVTASIKRCLSRLVNSLTNRHTLRRPDLITDLALTPRHPAARQSVGDSSFGGGYALSIVRRIRHTLSKVLRAATLGLLIIDNDTTDGPGTTPTSSTTTATAATTTTETTTTTSEVTTTAETLTTDSETSSTTANGDLIITVTATTTSDTDTTLTTTTDTATTVTTTTDTATTVTTTTATDDPTTVEDVMSDEATGAISQRFLAPIRLLPGKRRRPLQNPVATAGFAQDDSVDLTPREPSRCRLWALAGLCRCRSGRRRRCHLWTRLVRQKCPRSCKLVASSTANNDAADSLPFADPDLLPTDSTAQHDTSNQDTDGMQDDAEPEAGSSEADASTLSDSDFLTLQRCRRAILPSFSLLCVVEGTMLPHPFYCQCYYRCTQRRKQLHVCPGGRHSDVWAPSSRRCVPPSQSPCPLS